MALDLSIFNIIFGLSHKSGFVDGLIIFFAEYLPYIMALSALVLVFRMKDWKGKVNAFALIALSLILSRFLITELIRAIYFRPRPFVTLGIEPLINHSMTPAFPSGHAALFFALAFAVFLISKRLGAWLIVGSALMGIARVAAGVHWPMDIVAGALVALLSVAVVSWALRRPLKETNKKEATG